MSDDNWDFKVDEENIKEESKPAKKKRRNIPRKNEDLKLSDEKIPKRRKRGDLAKREVELASFAEIKNAPLSSRCFSLVTDIALFSALYIPLVMFTDKIFKSLTVPFYRAGLEKFVKISDLRSYDYVLYFVLVYFIIILLPSIFSKKTYGKRIFHLRVGHKFDDTPVVKSQMLIRELIRPLSIASILGLLFIFINQDRRALHDFIAGTKVYDED